MTYFILLIGAALLLSGLLLSIARSLSLHRKHTFFLTCAMVPIIFLGIGLYFLLPDAAPTAAEAVAISEGMMADPGPDSFLRSLVFGIVPGFIYFIVSTMMFFALRSLKSK